MNELWPKAVEIWVSGGWAMIALAGNAFILFFIGLSIASRLLGKPYRRVSEKKYRAWIVRPQSGRGIVGRLIELALGAANLHEMNTLFEEFRQTEITPFERDLRMMRVSVAASPLLGLLGTVMGMLATFYALAVGSGGDKTMDMVASGISEALVTTETGLIIALPGLLFLHHLQQEHERYKEFLAHIETACAQHLHRRLSASSREGARGRAAS